MKVISQTLNRVVKNKTHLSDHKISTVVPRIQLLSLEDFLNKWYLIHVLVSKYLILFYFHGLFTSNYVYIVYGIIIIYQYCYSNYISSMIMDIVLLSWHLGTNESLSVNDTQSIENVRFWI